MTQYCIFILGILTSFLVNDPRVKWRRWGCVVGLIGQPFWIYSAIVAHQWGIFALSIFYTMMWWRGVYHQWVRT